MTLGRTISRILVFSLVCTCAHAADSLPALGDAPDVDAEALPVPVAHRMTASIAEAQMNALRRAKLMAGCKIAPLTDITDPEALEFEKNAETEPANISGMTPDAAEALDSFEGMVAKVGGTFDLKSAYRPPAYQAHLHEVWVKWVKELRGSRRKGCQALREDVAAEFAKHQLLVKQQPVPSSDHTLGLAFDAAVALPRGAKLNGKRMTVDKLAALVGIKRPTIRRDPVHFKLVAPKPTVSAGFVQPATF